MEYFIDVDEPEGSIYIFFPLKQVQLKNSYVGASARPLAIFRQWTMDNLILNLNARLSTFTIPHSTPFHMEMVGVESTVSIFFYCFQMGLRKMPWIFLLR